MSAASVASSQHAPPTRGSTSARWLGFGFAALLVCAYPLTTSSDYYLHIGVLVLLNAALASSLSLIARTGQMSLCHAGFASAGGYISALAAMRLGIPPLGGVLLGGVAAGLIAFPLGWIILRLRGIYFVLVTFTFGQVLTLVAIDMQGVTGGANGLVGVPGLDIFGWPVTTRFQFFYVAAVFTGLVFLFTWRLLDAPAGRDFACVEENLQLSESTGIDTRRAQVLAFVIGSAIAGIAGALMTHYIRYISPDSFTFWNSVAFITMMVVGGRWALAGPFVGSLIITPLPEVLRAAGGLQHVIYGAILILVLQFLPGGIVGLPARLRELVSRRRGAPLPEAQSGTRS